MIREKTYGLFFLLLFTMTAFAQSGDNPFDLKPRVQAAAENKPYVPSNPFDIARPTNPLPPLPTAPLSTEQAAEYNDNTSSTSTAYMGNKEGFRRFFFIAYMSMLGLLTLSFILFRTAFTKTWRAFLNDNMLTQVHREQNIIAKLPYILMNLLFFINAALLLMSIGHYYQMPLLTQGYTSTFFLLTGAVALVFFIKHILLKLVGSIFPINKEMRLYAFTITIFSAVIGFFLIPINACIAYLPSGLTSPLLWLTLAAVSLIYLFRSLRMLFLGARYVSTNLFHFLLYICTVEIAPFIILLTWVSNQG